MSRFKRAAFPRLLRPPLRFLKVLSENQASGEGPRFSCIRQGFTSQTHMLRVRFLESAEFGMENLAVSL